MSDELSPDRLVRILDGIETIERSLGVLVKKRGATSRTAYKRDTDTQDIVERRFVKMTEAALDIGTTIVIHEQGTPPSSNPETMRLLNDLKVLSEDLSDEMAAAARFRRVMTHTNRAKKSSIRSENRRFRFRQWRKKRYIRAE